MQVCRRICILMFAIKVSALRIPIRMQCGLSSKTMSHWSKVNLAPPDKILGLNEAFKLCQHPQKVNLGVGAYRDDNGKPVTLESVRQAKVELSNLNLDHEYAAISGVQSYIDKSIEFAYGKNSPALSEGRVAAIQTLSGTGACRLAGEFLAKFFGRGKKMYMPDPTVCLLQL